MSSAATVWLLDANLLIALTHAAHIHHAEAHAWFHALPARRWATCAITQLAFLRLTSNPRVVGEAISPAAALEALAEMTGQPEHEYWPESPEPLHMVSLASPALVGHRQVTDAWLLGLAAHKQQVLATLDRGLVSFAAAARIPRAAELVDSSLTIQEPRKPYGTKRSRL